MLIQQPLEGLEDLVKGSDSRPGDIGVKVLRPTAILVIDALDECMDERDVKNLFEVLKHLKNVKFVRFRVHITSKNTTVISDIMNSLQDNVKNRDLSTIPTTEVNDDLRSYYENELHRLKEKYFQRHDQ